MKGKTEGELRSLLNLSGNLGKVARWHWEDFALDDDRDGGGSATDAGSDYHPPMFSFSGPAYQGLNPAACDGKALNYLASRFFHNRSGLRRALLPPGHASVSNGNGMPAVPPSGENEFGVPLEAARFHLPREGTGEDILRILPEVRR
jgi:hypothetical protein